VCRTTRYSAFKLVYGRDCLLPINLLLPSWSLVDWNEEVKTWEDLLVARMRQLDQQVLSEAQAAETLRNSWRANKAYFDVRNSNFGSAILSYCTILVPTDNILAKLCDIWRGPYQIQEVIESSTYYQLEVLDGTHLAASFAGNRLKQFFSQTETGAEDVSKVPDTAEGEEEENVETRRQDDEEADEETREEVGDELEPYWKRWRRIMGLPLREGES
jgi:hypothetical protein